MGAHLTFKGLGVEVAKETDKWPLVGRKQVNLVYNNPKKVYPEYRRLTHSNVVERSLKDTGNQLLDLARFGLLETLKRALK